MGKKVKEKDAGSETSKQNKPGSSKSWCTVCQNWFGDYQNHLKGKKHLNKTSYEQRMKNLAFTTFKKGIIMESPQSQLGREAILNYFRQYGNILALAKQESGDILVQYEEVFGAIEALKSSHHVIQGTSVTVRSRRMKRKTTENDSVEPQSSKAKIAQEIGKHFLDGSSGSLDDQAYQLIAKLQASEKLKTIKAKIVSDMSDWLLLKFPRHVLHMFGSSAMNIDLEAHSDMDLYLEYNPDTCITDSQEVKLKRLKTAAHVLSAHPDVKHFVVVRTARVPVAKFLHCPSGIHFDLICDNIKGVKNSEFIASLQSLDPRIRPFLLLLKLWAKANKLVGNPQVTLTSYALTLLGIFYLQKTEPALVPPIASLQSPVPANQRTIYDGWNFSYVLPEKTADKRDSRSIFTLFMGFFNFYQSFDPKNVVLCPLLGDVVPRENFTQTPPALDGKAFETYFQYLNNGGKPFKFGQQLAVQDPFELNFNVCSAFNKYDMFQSLCKKALNICSQSQCAAAEGEPVSIKGLFTMLS